MCGIAGFVGSGDRRDLAAMMLALEHRGPDGEGSYVDPGLGLHLGHRRLVILDKSGGTQPMWNAARTLAVIFNGEIYNHRELRAELEARGHVFSSSHSDTEVLVHGYQYWGTGLPGRLDGMFAFVVWDVLKKRLFLARDRFGEKPLHWFWNRRTFAFASELRALFRHRGVVSEAGGPGLRKYFAYGYVPSPLTIFKDVQKLPPGAQATFEIEKGEINVERYWRYTLTPDVSPRSKAELTEEFLSLFDRAVASRMIADVPVGYFLSGGVDSSAVVASAVRAANADTLRAFSIGFTEREFDESSYADRVARHLGVSSTIDQMEIDHVRHDAMSLLERAAEPIVDPSILPTYILSQATRRVATVALSGDGGDELFAGYEPFAAFAPARLLSRVAPMGVRRWLSSSADRFAAGEGRIGHVEKIQRALRGVRLQPACWLPAWMAPIALPELGALFDEPIHAEDVYAEAISSWNRNPDLSDIERAIEFFGNYYLPECVLAKVDRASMLASLEVRAPFLAKDVVDFCRRLPTSYKFRHGRSKILLKSAVAPRLPEGITTRAKRGFGIPLARWLRHSKWLEQLEPLPGLNFDFVQARARAHASGERDERLFLWAYMNLQACIAAVSR